MHVLNTSLRIQPRESLKSHLKLQLRITICLHIAAARSLQVGLLEKECVRRQSFARISQPSPRAEVPALPRVYITQTLLHDLRATSAEATSTSGGQKVAVVEQEIVMIMSRGLMCAQQVVLVCVPLRQAMMLHTHTCTINTHQTRANRPKSPAKLGHDYTVMSG